MNTKTKLKPKTKPKSKPKTKQASRKPAANKQSVNKFALKKLAQKLKPSGPPGKRSGLFLFLFFTILTIAVFGLVMILSASSHTALETQNSTWFWFRRQLIWFGLGMTALIITLRVDYHFWKKIAKPLLYISGALLFLTFIPGIGVSANGANRWIGIGAFTIQPVELTKLAVIIFFTNLLDSRQNRLEDTRLSIRPIIAILALFTLPILLQPDLGSAIVLGGIAFVIMFVVGVPLVSLGIWSGGSLLGVLLVSLQASYRRQRLLVFLDPWEDPLDNGYQTIQSLVAVASGGFWGRGIGSGRAKWGYLPYAHTDFIFAVIAEELGFVGAGLLLVAFSCLCIGGILTALRAPDLLGAAMAAGITAWITIQTFVNIGAAIGALPITGLPLPLVSFGGSSLIFTMAGLGILLNVARFSRNIK